MKEKINGAVQALQEGARETSDFTLRTLKILDVPDESIAFI